MENNKENEALHIGDIITRIVILGLMIAGIFQIYTTILDSNNEWYKDLILASLGVGNIFWSRDFSQWFWNV